MQKLTKMEKFPSKLEKFHSKLKKFHSKLEKFQEFHELDKSDWTKFLYSYWLKQSKITVQNSNISLKFALAVNYERL